MFTHYEALGVTRSASKDEIRSAYIIKAKAEHPDAGGNTTQFVQASNAYRVLTDGIKRKEYDAWLQANSITCSKCMGRGVIFKQKTIKERTSERCKSCKGYGIERQRR